MSELFDFILGKVVEVLTPRRAAIALFAPTGRRSRTSTSAARTPATRPSCSSAGPCSKKSSTSGRSSRSSLHNDAKLANAESIIAQRIRSASARRCRSATPSSAFSTSTRRLTAAPSAEGEARLPRTPRRPRRGEAGDDTPARRGAGQSQDRRRAAHGLVSQSRLLPRRAADRGYTSAGSNRPADRQRDYYDVIVRRRPHLLRHRRRQRAKSITAALIMSAVAPPRHLHAHRSEAGRTLLRELTTRSRADLAVEVRDDDRRRTRPRHGRDRVRRMRPVSPLVVATDARAS